MSYIQNLSARQQLAEISNYAHSSSGSIAGNIGMIGGHVVKFNTHWNERLLSRTTQDMLNASNQMRETLKGLIGQLVADEGKRTELMGLIDKRGGKSLLERSVVAKVVDSIDGTAQKNDLARYSSRRFSTDFASVEASVELRQKRYDAAWEAIGGEVQDISNRRFSGKMSESQQKRFANLVEDFLRESSMMEPQDGSSETSKDVLENQKYAVRVLSRLATDGAGFPVDEGEKVSPLNDPNAVHVDSMLGFARRHERLAARLLVYCDVEQINTLLSRMDESQLEKLENGVLNRSVVYTAVVGSQVPKGKDVEGVTPREFKELISDGIAAKMDELRDDVRNSIGDQAEEDNDFDRKLMLRDSLNYNFIDGRMGVVLSHDLVDKLKWQLVDKQEVKIGISDVKSAGPLYRVDKAQAQGVEGLRAQLNKDLYRGHHVLKVFGETFDFSDKVTAGMSESEKNAYVKEKVDQIIARLDEKCGGDENKKIVSGLLLTQAGLNIFSGLGDSGADFSTMTFSLNVAEDGSFEFTVDNMNNENAAAKVVGGGIIGANGENRLTQYEATINYRG